MILAGVIGKLQQQSEKETGAQKETSGLIRSLIEKMGLLQKATEDDTKDRQKSERDKKRRAGGRDTTEGGVFGLNKFRSALDAATRGISGFGKGLKNALTGLIETFSFSSLKNVLLSPLKLIGPGLLLGLGSALFGANLFGGGLLAAGALTGNPILMLAGAAVLVVKNFEAIVETIKTVKDFLNEWGTELAILLGATSALWVAFKAFQAWIYTKALLNLAFPGRRGPGRTGGPPVAGVPGAPRVTPFNVTVTVVATLIGVPPSVIVIEDVPKGDALVNGCVEQVSDEGMTPCAKKAGG